MVVFTIFATGFNFLMSSQVIEHEHLLQLLQNL